MGQIRGVPMAGMMMLRAVAQPNQERVWKLWNKFVPISVKSG